MTSQSRRVDRKGLSRARLSSAHCVNFATLSGVAKLALPRSFILLVHDIQRGLSLLRLEELRELEQRRLVSRIETAAQGGDRFAV
jgi:hypothetical protein